MRNLSTGWLVYLYPSSQSVKSNSSQELYTHIHRCRRSLMALKQSLWPRVIFFIIQATGQAPVMWPVPFGLMGGHFIREWLIVPVIKFALRSCEYCCFTTHYCAANNVHSLVPVILTKYVL